MVKIIVREAEPRDRRQIALFTSNTWSWGDYIMSVWRQWISDSNGKLLVAEYNHKVVGMMRVAFRPGGEAYLAGARVHPEYRRKGVATALTEKCIEHARKRGARFASLATASSNLPAIKLAEKLGFKMVGEFVEVEAWPKKTAEPTGLRMTEPGQAADIYRWIAERCRLRPVKFDFYDWSTLTVRDITEYLEEGFAAIRGSMDGVAFYQPYYAEKLVLMLDFILADKKASREIGFHLRREASILGCRKVWGFVPVDHGTTFGLKMAGFRVKKSRVRIYEVKV